MKILGIAFKDLLRSTRSASAFVFMLGIPLLVTGLFYFMFGRIADQGSFDIARTKVAIVNLDHAGPKLGTASGSLPGELTADTMSDLVVEVLLSEDLADLIEPVLYDDDAVARQAVDERHAQVAIIIPDGFSRQFADSFETASIEFYQDPTLTLGPGIIKSMLSQFMDNLSAVKIAVNIALELANGPIVGQVVDHYLDASSEISGDLTANLIEEILPVKTQPVENPVVRIIGPVMAGMIVFYAFYTGVATAQSILREEEERTLPRLFTTPTTQAEILTGKFLTVFITVTFQISFLLFFGQVIFGISWGDLNFLLWVIAGTVLGASSFGIFVNSFLKDTRQGGVVFGGVLTFTGMLGMIRVIGSNSSAAQTLGDTVSLIVPQGWAVRGFVYALDARQLLDARLTFLALLAWSALFFAVGIWRFNKRYV